MHESSTAHKAIEKSLRDAAELLATIAAHGMTVVELKDTPKNAVYLAGAPDKLGKKATLAIVANGGQLVDPAIS